MLSIKNIDGQVQPKYQLIDNEKSAKKNYKKLIALSHKS